MLSSKTDKVGSQHQVLPERRSKTVNNGAIVLAVNKVKGRHLVALRGHEVPCLELVMADS